MDWSVQRERARARTGVGGRGIIVAAAALSLAFMGCSKTDMNCWWSGKCEESKKVGAEVSAVKSADGSPVLDSYLNIEKGDYAVLSIRTEDPNKTERNPAGTGGKAEYVKYTKASVSYSGELTGYSRDIVETIPADGATHPVSVEVVSAGDKGRLFAELLGTTNEYESNGTTKRTEAARVNELYDRYGGVYKEVTATVVLTGTDTNGKEQEVRGTILVRLGFKRAS